MKASQQDRTKGSKIRKRANKSTPQKAKIKIMERNWNIPSLLKFYERSQTSSNEETLEGDTLIEDAVVIKCEDEDEDETTIMVEENFSESAQGTENACVSFQDRTLRLDDPRLEDWSDDEIWVLNKLVMRGQEPLLPYELASEFPSWPDILFTKNQTKIVINNISRSTTNRKKMIPSPRYQANTLSSRIGF